MLKPEDLSPLSDEELLQIQIRKLHLTIKDTKLEKSIQQLYSELDEKGIAFHPPCYLSDEWFSPDGIPVIGIPFYLAHPRLVKLERKMMLEVEGGTEAWCMKLLRHEAGHALNHAYKLYRKTRWRKLFGSYTKRYSVGGYETRPYSKRYVIHLDDHYAQSHPEEDFAETFGVWLNPSSNWEKKYRGWPAIKKLNYVDHLMKKISSREPTVKKIEKPFSASRLRSTLAVYYERKRRWLKTDFPGFYDPALLRIFSTKQDDYNVMKASRFLRTQKRYIINSVSRWTGERKYDIDGLIKKLARRCDEMDLYLNRADTLFDITAFITSVISSSTQLIHKVVKK